MTQNTIQTVTLADIDAFMGRCQTVIDGYMQKSFPNLPREVLYYTVGPRYIRLVRCQEGKTAGSAWAFIDRTNGDILKPAGFKTPAKHARGNIFDAAGGMKYVGPYGPAYLR